MTLRQRLMQGCDRAWLERTYPMYLAELQQLGSDYICDASGRWQPDLLPYWLDPSQPVEIWLFSVAEHDCGFCFLGIDAFPYKSARADYQISEFYLLPNYRKRGLAQQMASQVIRDRSGFWEMEVLKTNQPALRFWRKVLVPYADLHVQERERDFLLQFHS